MGKYLYTFFDEHNNVLDADIDPDTSVWYINLHTEWRLPHTKKLEPMFEGMPLNVVISIHDTDVFVKKSEYLGE